MLELELFRSLSRSAQEAYELLHKCWRELDACLDEATFKRYVESGVVTVGMNTPLGSTSQTQQTAQAEDQI